jgi:hypothetical protein
MENLSDIYKEIKFLRKRRRKSLFYIAETFDLPTSKIREICGEVPDRRGENWICFNCKDGYFQAFHEPCPYCKKWYSDTAKIIKQRSLAKTLANNVIAG